MYMKPNEVMFVPDMCIGVGHQPMLSPPGVNTVRLMTKNRKHQDSELIPCHPIYYTTLRIRMPWDTAHIPMTSFGPSKLLRWATIRQTVQTHLGSAIGEQVIT